MVKIGFDNEKYLTTQSQHIRDRIAQRSEEHTSELQSPS